MVDTEGHAPRARRARIRHRRVGLGADGAEAEMVSAARRRLAACRAVMENWEKGDLARAARECAAAVKEADGG